MISPNSAAEKTCSFDFVKTRNRKWTILHHPSIVVQLLPVKREEKSNILQLSLLFQCIIVTCVCWLVATRLYRAVAVTGIHIKQKSALLLHPPARIQLPHINLAALVGK